MTVVKTAGLELKAKFGTARRNLKKTVSDDEKKPLGDGWFCKNNNRLFHGLMIAARLRLLRKG